MTVGFLRTETAESALERNYPNEFEAAATGCAEIIVDQLLNSALFCNRHECGCGNMVFRDQRDLIGVRDYPHPLRARCQVELHQKLVLESSLNGVWDEVARVLRELPPETQMSKYDRRLKRRLERLEAFVGISHARRAVAA